MNELFVASVANYVGTATKPATPDRQGNDPIIFNVIAGKCPNRQVQSGTIGESLGVEVGKTYLMQVRETEPDPQWGRRFTFNKLKELDAMEIVDLTAKLGKGTMVEVESSSFGSLEEVSAEVETADVATV